VYYKFCLSSCAIPVVRFCPKNLANGQLSLECFGSTCSETPCCYKQSSLKIILQLLKVLFGRPHGFVRWNKVDECCVHVGWWSWWSEVSSVGRL